MRAYHTLILPKNLSISLPVALTIAGFDPSGGAGVLADARTFEAFGCHSLAAITSVTFQNARNVFGAVHQSGETVSRQVMALLEDATIACAKTGMLPTLEVVSEVARLFRETDLPAPVVDPVMISSSGARLMEEDALQTFITELLPLARLVTPNIPEAEVLTGSKITSEDKMRAAAAAIRKLGPRAVLIKGGHLKSREADGGRQRAEGSRRKAEGRRRERATNKAQDPSEEAIDVLDNEGRLTVFRERRVSDVELHGSGCILSAAIAAGLGKGMTMETAVDTAKAFVLEAIRKSKRADNASA